MMMAFVAMQGSCTTVWAIVLMQLYSCVSTVLAFVAMQGNRHRACWHRA
jgi:hypothetical protein